MPQPQMNIWTRFDAHRFSVALPFFCVTLNGGKFVGIGSAGRCVFVRREGMLVPKTFKLAAAVVAVLSVAAAARGDILITNGPLTVEADSSSGAVRLGDGAYSSATHSLLHGLATSSLQEPSVLWQVLATLKPGQGVSTPRAINGRARIDGALTAHATAATDRRPLVMGSLHSRAGSWEHFAITAPSIGNPPIIGAPLGGIGGPVGFSNNLRWGPPGTGISDGGGAGGRGTGLPVMPLPPAVWMGLAGIAGVIALRRRRIA